MQLARREDGPERGVIEQSQAERAAVLLPASDVDPRLPEVEAPRRDDRELRPVVEECDGDRLLHEDVAHPLDGDGEDEIKRRLERVVGVGHGLTPSATQALEPDEGPCPMTT